MKYLTILLLVFICLPGCTKWYENYGVTKSTAYTKESIPKIINALDDENPSVRMEAIRYLQRHIHESNDVVEKIQYVADHDGNENVRNYAHSILEKTTPIFPVPDTYNIYVFVKDAPNAKSAFQKYVSIVAPWQERELAKSLAYYGYGVKQLDSIEQHSPIENSYTIVVTIDNYTG